MFQAIAPERLLRVRRHVPDQQRHRQSAPRRAGHVLPGPRRLQPRTCASGASAHTRRTSGGSSQRLTFNYGLRYERINPFTEAQDRLNGFVPGRAVDASGPTRRAGSCFPGDPGIGRGHRAERQRVHAACRRGMGSDRRAASGRCARATASSTTNSRTAPGTASQVADERDAMGAVQPVQRRRPELPEPVSGTRLSRRRTRSCGRPRCSRSIRTARPPVPRTGTSASSDRCSTSTSSKFATSGAEGRLSRATSKPTPPCSGQARRRRTPTGGASTPTARPTAAACDFSTVAMLRNITRSSYHAGQASLSRRFRVRRRRSTSSYWFSKSLDHCRR